MILSLKPDRTIYRDITFARLIFYGLASGQSPVINARCLPKRVASIIPFFFLFLFQAPQKISEKIHEEA